MNDPIGSHLDRLDPGDLRRIDAVCRRFEADRRAGQRPRVEDYLDGFLDEGRAALRAELEALERELRQADETIARSDPGPIAEAPTIAPASPPTAPIPGLAASSVHEEATVPPRDQATVDLRSSAPPPDASEPARVRYFGDYEIEGELARGGMGVVFRARQISLNRPVALKMILAGQLADDTDVKRFYTEAEAAANLDHPGIVPIYEVGQHEGQHYFSMGFVEGQSLSQRLAEGPLPPREAAALIVKVAEAIEYAHSRGVIHRDLKPGNILLDRSGNPRVTDFGLAKKLEGDSGLTGSGQIMGTPSYMPPEQAGGSRGEIGPASDVYSLGATLYALAIGRPPFQAATPMDTVIQVISDEPVPPRRLNAAIPHDLETICLKCLEKESGKRYATATALAEDLRRFLAGEPIVARPVTRLERAVKWARRKPTIAALLGLVALVTASGLGGVLWQWRQAVQQTELAEQRLYDVRMNLVQRYWEDDNGAFVQKGLNEQLMANQGGVDRRGFEWFYWQRKMSSGHITLTGHTLEVMSVAFSPDGQRLASSSRDQLKVWDAKTGQEIRTLRGQMGWVNCVAFSPDGQRLASTSTDGTLKVWDVGTGQEVHTLKGHTSAVNSVAYSPGGQRLASAGDDQTVRLWDAATGHEIRTLKGHIGIVASVAFAPNGKWLASSGWDQTVKMWDAATGLETRTLKGHTSRVVSVAFSPDGTRLASASNDQTVKVWDAGTGRETLSFKGHTNGVMSVAFSPDGQRVVSASRHYGQVKVWDAETGQEVRTLKGHTNTVNSVAYSPDGQWIASAGADHAVMMWNAGTSQETLTLKGYTGPANSETTTVRLSDRRSVVLKGNTGPVESVAFTPDGQRLAFSSWDLTVKVSDAKTGQDIRSVRGHESFVKSVAFSPDGHRLASASDDGTVKVWDAGTWREILNLKGHTQGVRSVAFSPDGLRIASAGGDRTVKVWDARNGQEIRTLRGPTTWATSVAFSPNGLRIACGGGAVKIWDTTTGKETLTFGVVANGVAFSPDGQRLACGGGDLKMCDTTTGKETLTLKGHTEHVTCVAYSPDGQRLASASEDQTVKIWDAATGLETLTLKGHSGAVMSVAYSPDGQRLASAGRDGTVKVWDARPPDADPAKPGPNPR